MSRILVSFIITTRETLHLHIKKKERIHHSLSLLVVFNFLQKYVYKNEVKTFQPPSH
jgi:hypothetical protein